MFIQCNFRSKQLLHLSPKQKHFNYESSIKTHHDKSIKDEIIQHFKK